MPEHAACGSRRWGRSRSMSPSLSTAEDAAASGRAWARSLSSDALDRVGVALDLQRDRQVAAVAGVEERLRVEVGADREGRRVARQGLDVRGQVEPGRLATRSLISSSAVISPRCRTRPVDELVTSPPRSPTPDRRGGVRRQGRRRRRRPGRCRRAPEVDCRGSPATSTSRAPSSKRTAAAMPLKSFSASASRMLPPGSSGVAAAGSAGRHRSSRCRSAAARGRRPRPPMTRPCECRPGTRRPPARRTGSTTPGVAGLVGPAPGSRVVGQRALGGGVDDRPGRRSSVSATTAQSPSIDPAAGRSASPAPQSRSFASPASASSASLTCTHDHRRSGCFAAGVDGGHGHPVAEPRLDVLGVVEALQSSPSDLLEDALRGCRRRRRGRARP